MVNQKRNRTLIAILLLVISFGLQAQHKDPENKGGDGKVVDAPKEVTKYDAEPVYHVVKISPFHLIRGELPIFYEGRLSDKFTLELGGGITFFNTTGWIWDLINNEGFTNLSNTNYKIGPTGTTSLKYFFGENAMRGWHTGLNYRYSMYRFNHTPHDAFFPYSLNTQYHEGLLEFGYQNMNRSEKLFFQWYLAVGLKYRKDKTLIAKNTGYTYTYAVSESDWRSVPAFKLGLKLGLQLK